MRFRFLENSLCSLLENQQAFKYFVVPRKKNLFLTKIEKYVDKKMMSRKFDVF